MYQKLVKYTKKYNMLQTAGSQKIPSLIDNARTALSSIRGQLIPVLEKYSQLKPTHTKYGTGVRTTYPASSSRDILKTGQEPVPYEPVYYVADVVISSIWAAGKSPAQSWADPENPAEIAAQIAAGRKRVTPYGTSIANQPFEIINGFPVNPLGKTGFTGRGELGLWGANPAADPIIFRTINNIFCVLLIQRADGAKEWAFPGGMVDPTDSTISAAAVRELREETGFSVTDLVNYSLGMVYSGYVDDARNTDNAWMETNAFAWYLPAEVPSNKIKLFADGDETLAVKWVPVTPELLEDGKLFASHGAILRDAIRKLI
jgi:ADP-ribose pyrophosphatase